MSRTRVYFDGHELTDRFIASDLREPLLPRNIETLDVSGRDGALLAGVSLAARTVTMTLTARGRTLDERRDAGRALAAILAVDGPRELAISADRGLYWLAVPSSDNDASIYVNHTSFEVGFLVTDPAMYGDERTVTVPSGGSVTFDVDGTYPAHPVVSAPSAANDGTLGGWRLRMDDGSYLMLTVPAGAQTASVVADCGGRVLTVNGVTALLRPDADWLVLEPGTHTVEMTGTGAATITYRERWL